MLQPFIVKLIKIPRIFDGDKLFMSHFCQVAKRECTLGVSPWQLLWRETRLKVIECQLVTSFKKLLTQSFEHLSVLNRSFGPARLSCALRCRPRVRKRPPGPVTSLASMVFSRQFSASAATLASFRQVASKHGHCPFGAVGDDAIHGIHQNT